MGCTVSEYDNTHERVRANRVERHVYAFYRIYTNGVGTFSAKCAKGNAILQMKKNSFELQFIYIQYI